MARILGSVAVVAAGSLASFEAEKTAQIAAGVVADIATNGKASY